MKTFKRALSCFLAMLMAFSTFTVLAVAADQTDGNSVEMYTDFRHEGICEGEKYFYVCRR